MPNARDKSGDKSYQELEGGGIDIRLMLETLGPTATQSEYTCSYGMMLATIAMLLMIFGFVTLLKFPYNFIKDQIKDHYLIAGLLSKINATRVAVKFDTIDVKTLFRHFAATKKKAIDDYVHETHTNPGNTCTGAQRELEVVKSDTPWTSGRNRLSLRMQTAIGVVYNDVAKTIEEDKEKFTQYHENPEHSYEYKACRLVKCMFTQGACFYACPSDYAYKSGYSPFTFHVDDALMAFWCFNRACIYYSADFEALGLTETFCAPGWLKAHHLTFGLHKLNNRFFEDTRTKYASLTYYVKQYTEKAADALKKPYEGALIMAKKGYANGQRSSICILISFGVGGTWGRCSRWYCGCFHQNHATVHNLVGNCSLEIYGARGFCIQCADYAPSYCIRSG